MRELASDQAILRKRLRRLLGQDPTGSPNEISKVILPTLEQVGKLALIGGAVRDVARVGVERFHSDLDFVLYDGDDTKFHRLMVELKGSRNRFGGYSIRFHRWRVDIWSLESTWARKAGLRSVAHIDDLLTCTFFDWDAIIYDLATKAILAKPGYFEALTTYVMDVNLEANPNPTGSLVRALRRGALWRVRFGPKLTDFARRQLAAEDWIKLVHLDEKAFTKPVLRWVDPSELRKRLERDIPLSHTSVTEPFGPPKQQLPLFLDQN